MRITTCWLSPLLGGAVLLVFIGVGIQLSSKFLRKPLKGNGFAAPGWYRVADVFRHNLDSGLEQGAGFVIYYKGEMVVEFYGGYADYDAEWSWNKDVISQAASSSKGVTCLLVAMLVDRGLLDYNKPVASYWPEFSQNGKEEITVEQLLSHQAGLAVLDEKYSAYDMNDPVKMAKILAEQKPNWEPGTGHGYHGITQGLYIDQLVRRVDPQHRSVQQFLDEEVAKPLGLDIYLGLPKEEFYRCSRLKGFNPASLESLTATRYWPVIWNYLTDSQSLISRSIQNPPEWSQEGIENHPDFKQIQNPATHIFGTVESFAKLFGTLASNTGQTQDEKLLSDSTRAKLFEPLVSGRDNILLMNVTYGRGGTLRVSPLGSTMHGTPGSGGQMIYMDPQYELGWAYLTNHHSIHAIGDDPRYLALEKAMYQCIKDIIKQK